MRKRFSIFAVLAALLLPVCHSAAGAGALNVVVSGYRIGSSGDIVSDLLNPNIVRVSPRGISVVFPRDRSLRVDAVPGSGYAVIGWQKFYSDPSFSYEEPIMIAEAVDDGAADAGGSECRSVEIAYEEKPWVYLVPVLKDLVAGRDDLMRVMPIGYRIGSSGDIAAFDQSVFAVSPSGEEAVATRAAPVSLTARPTRDYRVVCWQKFYEYPPADNTAPYVEFGAGSESVSLYPEVGANMLYVAVVLEYDPVRTVKAEVSSFGRGTVTISPELEIYHKGDSLTLTAQPDVGYQFVRWSDGQGDHRRALTVQEDVDLKAYIEPKSSTVSFAAGAGAVCDMAGKRVTYDQTYGRLAECLRTGYAFAGWHTAATGGTKVDSRTTVAITEAQTLYALWTANTYEVTFDANGGTALPAPVASVTYDSVYGLLPTPVRQGFAFAGWYTAADGGTKVESDTKVTVTEAQTLYAHWTASEYSLTLDPNGGRYEGDENARTFPEKLRFGATNLHELAAAVRTNYTLKGYYTSKNGGIKVYDANGRNVGCEYWTTDWPTGTFRGTLDLRVYANWMPDGNNVSLEKEGGVGGADSILAQYEVTVPTIDTPMRKGYDFEGYYTLRNGDGTKYYGRDGVGLRAWTSAGTTNLYANWTPHSYRIQYELDGGSARTDAPSSARVGTAFRVSAPKRTGYAFAGWNVAGAGADYTTAKWGVASDAVTLAVTNESAVCGDASSNGVYFVDLATERDASVTLKANWSASSYTVTFEPNGGEAPSFASTNVTYGSTYGTLPTCERPGYSFLGWYTAAEGGWKVDSHTVVELTGAQTLYAHWGVGKYTVEYEIAGSGNGRVEGIGVYAYGDQPTLKAVPYEGSAFTGWADGETRNPRRVTVLSNAVYVAEFETAAYEVTFTYRDATGNPVTTAPTNVAHGTAAIAPEVPKWPEHTFKGWSTEEYKKVTRDLSVEAIYDSETYSVVFTYRDSDGNCVTTMPQNVVVGGKATPPSQDIVNNWTGHSFKGWRPDYNVIRQDTVCEAIYDDKTYTITFSYCDAKGEELKHVEIVRQGEKVSFDYVESVKNLWDGHLFDYWSTGGKKIDDIDNVIAMNDMQIAANYVPCNGTIVYTDVNGKTCALDVELSDVEEYVKLLTMEELIEYGLEFNRPGYQIPTKEKTWLGEKTYKDGEKVPLKCGQTLILVANTEKKDQDFSNLLTGDKNIYCFPNNRSQWQVGPEDIKTKEIAILYVEVPSAGTLTFYCDDDTSKLTSVPEASGPVELKYTISVEEKSRVSITVPKGKMVWAFGWE